MSPTLFCVIGVAMMIASSLIVLGFFTEGSKKQKMIGIPISSTTLLIGLYLFISSSFKFYVPHISFDKSITISFDTYYPVSSVKEGSCGCTSYFVEKEGADLYEKFQNATKAYKKAAEWISENDPRIVELKNNIEIARSQFAEYMFSKGYN